MLGALVGYLLLGLGIATSMLPEQMWVCPDASAPHGEVTYGDRAAATHPDCRPTVTGTEQAGVLAWGTVVWLPLLVAKGLSNVSEQRRLDRSSGG